MVYCFYDSSKIVLRLHCVLMFTIILKLLLVATAADDYYTVAFKENIWLS